ncbi:nitroreductase family protein [Faecalibacterium sp. An121]|uniref:nitroreductase family protein n=1 Tax=Faecalibacterium sp. An121 TaxID=1965550 RepID=UPI000B36FE8E|nr:nitroreductase family protein [Faecalibacterium sp. An121]OUQ33988.1 hypothetical protein B5E66_12465 [Faecalibacterium sp. An121]
MGIPSRWHRKSFTFSLDGSNVTAKAGIGFYSKIDLGIAKYHFELGAGAENFSWNVSAPRNSVLAKPSLPVRKSFHGVAVYF